MTRPLADCRVLYTRAAQHWDSARSALEALGADVRHIPLLDTRPLPFTLKRPPDDAVFTSANAVRHFFTQSTFDGQSIAIGEKTAQALRNAGQNVAILTPPPYDSEALLAHWQPRGRHIVIVAAPGGRSLLQQTLSAHNHVEMLYVYERFCPTPTLELSAENIPDAVFAGSRQTLRYLTKIAQPDTLKLLQCRTCVVALSPRIADFATQLGFHRTISAGAASESAQIAALCQWWTRQ